MKKFIYLIMVLLSLITFTACGSTTADESTRESKIDSSIGITDSTKNQEPKKKVYNHTALQGAVIVYTDGNKVSYQRKCESCGNLKSGKTTIYRNNSTYNSSFVCDKCKNHQIIKIQTTSSYQ